MCGILGLHNSNGVPPPGERFAAALDRLHSRGPDDSGIWHDEHVVLGHRRLSIIDLSPTGRQPMESSDRRYTIVFNGEIYNHRELRPLLSPLNGWRGTSDTETLLEAYRTWGVGCLSRHQRHVRVCDLGSQRTNAVCRARPDGGETLLLCRTR